MFPDYERKYRLLDRREERPLTDEELTDGVVEQLGKAQSAMSQAAWAGHMVNANVMVQEAKSRAQRSGDNSQVEKLAERVREELPQLSFLFPVPAK